MIYRVSYQSDPKNFTWSSLNFEDYVKLNNYLKDD